jgi:hypothetical protein
VEAGQAVTRKLPTADKPEIAAFGIVRVHTDKETFLGKLRDLESFRRGPSTLEIGLLGNPPSIEDLRGLSLDDADFEAARRCRPGDCGLKLSRSAMERIRSEMEWSAPDAKTKAAALMRQMHVEYTAAYMEGGTPAMATCHNRDRPQEMPAEFRKLLGASPYLVEYVPEFHRYLEDYPRGTLVGAENLFYWEKARFGPKPTISVYHVTIWKDPKDASWAIVSSKQIYASHYFRAGFDLSALLDAGEGAFYLLDLYRVRIDPPTGMLSGLVLGKIRGRIEHGVAERLKSAKARAEAR